MALRDTAKQLEPSVLATLSTLEMTDTDRAAAQLALTYARMIDANPDDPNVLERHGPKLLSALIELGVTRRSAAALSRDSKTPPQAVENKLTQFRTG